MQRLWTTADMLRLVRDRCMRSRWAAELVEAGADLGDWGWLDDARLLDPPARHVEDPVAARVRAVSATLKAAQDLTNRHRSGGSSK